MTAPADEPGSEPVASASQINTIAPYLVLVAETLRPGWDPGVLADAFIACGTAGWTPGRLLREFARLIADEEATARDLTYLAASPTQREPVTSRARNVPEYAAFRERLEAMPPLPEHRGQRDAATPVVRKDDPPRSAA